MANRLAIIAFRLRLFVKRNINPIVGRTGVALLKMVRRMDPDRAANVAGWLMRRLGPLLPEHRIGRANLQAAFPEKPRSEINAILSGVWDNLGRVAAEFAHLDRLWNNDPDRRGWHRIEASPRTRELEAQLRDDGKPALIFGAHLANWELPAVVATGMGAPSAVLYRRPSIREIDHFIHNVRAASMGELIAARLDAPARLADALTRGLHVGLLVDQYFANGVDVTFFGRRTKANPLIARLARQIECPIHGVHAIRLPGNRFRVEITKEVVPLRDAEGKIDIAATMQRITDVVESWVREHPEQWLWLHRRWR